MMVLLTLITLYVDHRVRGISLGMDSVGINSIVVVTGAVQNRCCMMLCCCVVRVMVELSCSGDDWAPQNLGDGASKLQSVNASKLQSFKDVEHEGGGRNVCKP